ncbi:GNAT family N-acetyltransferase [Paracoccus sp. M683]|uniref:GNAT family N-acetyltransferase n=1 Tax=Paracoccus sp. M683 TaxID=2594268 RepID=UPI00117E6EA4|nr:GNAT family N-acetyltransferase [Paracoccus sp. M683]TRW98657.1 GNAT family N-acetyltransferase [Paracoccus sp. M683]
MTVTTRVLTGQPLADALEDVARLRIAVFRDWPYLYDGDLDYERDYLKAYQSPGAVVVVAEDSGRIVGASTGAPMRDHAQDFGAAFAGRPEPLDQIFYCAESVLLPDYRGHGLGHAFFDAREDHARALGLAFSAFCSVTRPADHPDRPANYRPLDGFWRKRGYQPLPGVVAHFAWKDHGQAEQTDKPLQFWMRTL